MLNFLTHPKIILAQGNFVAHTFWKIQFNSHDSLFLCFFCGYGSDSNSRFGMEDQDQSNRH
jgi:hypothetical protein